MKIWPANLKLLYAERQRWQPAHVLLLLFIAHTPKTW